MNTFKKKLGAQIKQARKRAYLTQEDLAVIVEKEGKEISRYETGKTCPMPEMLDKIATATNTSVDQLLSRQKTGLSSETTCEKCMPLETINKLYLELSQIATVKTADEIYNEQEIERLHDVIRHGMDLFCAATGRDINDYDSDQSDIACYMDCFDDAAKVIEMSGIKFDPEEGDFLRHNAEVSNDD